MNVLSLNKKEKATTIYLKTNMVEGVKFWFSRGLGLGFLLLLLWAKPALAL